MILIHDPTFKLCFHAQVFTCFSPHSLTHLSNLKKYYFKFWLPLITYYPSTIKPKTLLQSYLFQYYLVVLIHNCLKNLFTQNIYIFSNHLYLFILYSFFFFFFFLNNIIKFFIFLYILRKLINFCYYLKIKFTNID